MFDVYEIRKQFPMLKEDKKMQNKKLIFLDNCSTTFKPQCVIDEVINYYNNETSNSHRGDYDLCFNVEQKVTKTRENVARFVNAHIDEIVFTSGTTMGINLIAYGYGLKNLKKGDEIIISEAEHASNVLPWYRLAELTGAVVKFAPLNEKGMVTPESLKKVITNKTKIVSFAHIGNVLGYTIDVKALAKIAHEHGAIYISDGAQSVPHIKTNFKDWDIDFLAFSAHKMCGPTGVGVLVGKRHLLEEMDPFLMGGGMNVKFDTCGATYLEAPAKFEAGTQNLAGIIAFGKAVEFIESIGIENIHQHEIELKRYMVEKLSKADNVIIYNAESDGGMLTFNIKGVFAQDEATLLNSKGIALRSGQHCAKILNDFLKTPATVRASTYFYTTKEEVDVFIDALINGGDILDAYFN